MAISSTIHRFTIEVSDVDGSRYHSHDLRVALHPSETVEAMLVRVLAYCLLYEEGMAFTRGLSTSEEPALWVKDLAGQLHLWVDIGSPKGERVHKASKKSPRVCIWTHKDPDRYLASLGSQKIHRREDIELVCVPPDFIAALAAVHGRKNDWTLVRSDGVVYLTVGEESFETTLASRRLGE